MNKVYNSGDSGSPSAKPKSLEKYSDDSPLCKAHLERLSYRCTRTLNILPLMPISQSLYQSPSRQTDGKALTTSNQVIAGKS